jgi:hypothetical protein
MVYSNADATDMSIECPLRCAWIGGRHMTDVRSAADASICQRQEGG